MSRNILRRFIRQTESMNTRRLRKPPVTENEVEQQVKINAALNKRETKRTKRLNNRV